MRDTKVARSLRYAGIVAVAVCATATVLTLWSPATAAAAPGSVAVNGRTLVFQAGPGTANDVAIGRIFPRPFYWGVQDKGVNAPIVPGTGCKLPTRSAYPFECDPVTPGTEIGQVRANLGDGDDTYDIDIFGGSSPDARVVARVNGGAGSDRLTGGPQPDVITGGPGANIVKAGDGNDRLEMRNGARDTLIDCGAGTDTAVVDRVDRTVACERVLRAR